MSISYDVKGNISSIADGDGYLTIFEYDDLDRLKKSIYPDGTFDVSIYKYLDIEWETDRAGLSTHYYLDSERKLIAVEDPLGRTIKYSYCPCGVLHTLTDPAGNISKWEYDAQSRPIKKINPDNSIEACSYDCIGRVLSHTDIAGQVLNYIYNIDNTIATKHWTNLSLTTAPTHSISYTYDQIFPRQTSMIDCTGTTSYNYNLYNGQTGAGSISSVTGPIGSGSYIMSAQYDDMGRLILGSLDGSTISIVYDTLGRVLSETCSLGSFTYSYIGNSNRVASVNYPNGIVESYDYFGNIGGKHLKQIKHIDSTNLIVSQFDYTYHAKGSVKDWRQQLGSSVSSAYTWKPAYDAANQLLTVDQVSVPTNVLSKRWDYSYDSNRNRLNHTVLDNSFSIITPYKAVFNNLNQLLSLISGEGQIYIEGATNKNASVTVNGEHAKIDGNRRFNAKISTTSPSMTTIIAITATDDLNQRAPLIIRTSDLMITFWKFLESILGLG